MGHYAAEMGADTPHSINSPEAKAAREADCKRQTYIDDLVMQGIRGMNSNWMKPKRLRGQCTDGDGI